MRRAETRTSAQFALVVAQASDDYAAYPLFWAALLALIAGGAIAVTVPTMSLAISFAIQAAVFVAAGVLFHLRPLRFRVVPAREKGKHASQLARLQFAALVHERTQAEVGLLLFVSLAEHHVEILVDRRIAAVVQTDAWQRVIDQFIADVRAGRLAEGFIGAIESGTKILEQSFPPHAGQKSEIPDRVTEI